MFMSLKRFESTAFGELLDTRKARSVAHEAIIALVLPDKEGCRSNATAPVHLPPNPSYNHD